MVKRKATVRRLPDYIRQLRADAGELPHYWLSSYYETDPPSVGSEDASPTNLMSSGLSVSSPSDGLIWEGNRWDTPGDKERWWETNQSLSRDNIIFWGACNYFGPSDKNTSTLSATGTYNNNGRILITMSIANSPRLTIQYDTGDLSGDEAYSAYLDDVIDSRFVWAAIYDENRGQRIWVHTSNNSNKSSNSATVSTLNSGPVSIGNRIGGTVDPTYLSFFEFGVANPAPTDSYVENDLIPGLKNAYF